MTTRKILFRVGFYSFVRLHRKVVRRMKLSKSLLHSTRLLFAILGGMLRVGSISHASKTDSTSAFDTHTALQIPGCVIIAEAWLHECFRLGRRVDEAPYVLAKPQAAVGAASSVRVHADKSVICDNRSTADILPHGDGQGVVPVDSADVDDTLLELSSATRAAMDQEVLDAMESDSASEADSDTDGMGGGTDNAVDANDTTDSRIVGVEHITGVQDGKITDHDRANGHHTAQPDAVDDGLGMSREEILGLDADDDDDDSEDRRGWKRPRTSLSPPRAAVRSSEAADSATSSSDSDASDDDDVLDADFARALNAKFDQSTGSGQII
eukprot:m.874144 g.874144  ORF g.874144 m.874144 type:complete len:325 (+) comp23573_c0_seq13:250-1224(+)